MQYSSQISFSLHYVCLREHKHIYIRMKNIYLLSYASFHKVALDF